MHNLMSRYEEQLRIDEAASKQQLDLQEMASDAGYAFLISFIVLGLLAGLIYVFRERISRAVKSGRAGEIQQRLQRVVKPKESIIEPV